MKASMTTLAACLVATVAASGSASAEPDVAVSAIRSDCIAYVSADGSDEVLWGQILSLAGCIQDVTVADITSSEQLAPTLDALARALGPSTALYVYVVEHGTVPAQLRATYQIGMSFVGLATRARASIRMPPPGDSAALARYLALHAQLEPLLVRVTLTARIAFTLIDRAVRHDPTLASDAVARYMIGDARRKLEQLGGALQPEEREQIAAR